MDTCSGNRATRSGREFIVTAHAASGMNCFQVRFFPRAGAGSMPAAAGISATVVGPISIAMEKICQKRGVPIAPSAINPFGQDGRDQARERR